MDGVVLPSYFHLVGTLVNYFLSTDVKKNLFECNEYLTDSIKAWWGTAGHGWMHGLWVQINLMILYAVCYFKPNKHGGESIKAISIMWRTIYKHVGNSAFGVVINKSVHITLPITLQWMLYNPRPESWTKGFRINISIGCITK